MALEPGEFRPIEGLQNAMLGMGVYHGLYRASEYIGGETWGDNLAAHTKFVKFTAESNRQKDNFRVLLLGSATPTSIKQTLAAIEQWESEGLIKKGKLTVVDLKPDAYNGLEPELKQKVEFVKMDVTRPGFQPGSFDFITSDYLLNFIPRTEIAATIRGLGTLLDKGGVFDAAVDTQKRSLIGKTAAGFFVRNGLTKEQLDNLVLGSSEYSLIERQKAYSRGLAKMNQIGADRIVWGFSKKML